MIEKIKELRVRIDGLSQLVKELKPFEWITGIDKDYVIQEGTSKNHSNIYQVTDSLSFGEPNKYHYLLRTDRGTFRCGSDYTLDFNMYFKTIDRNSKEINKAYDSLILAKAWLGKILGELGTESPYTNDGNRKEVKDIEPIAEKAEVGIVDYDNYSTFNHVEKVDWLRQEIQKVEIEVRKLNYGNVFQTENLIRQYLCEARFWLGFELGRIRDAKV